MRRKWLLAGLLPWFAQAGLAQDERRVASPDGQLEFRIFVAQPAAAPISRLAYQVFLRGQRVLDTSFLGFDIHDQYPFLGENVGLTSCQLLYDARYNSLVAEYMQNGSLGRRITVEARVWNGGVAFRYLLPRTTPLLDLEVDDELTEFSFAAPVAQGGPATIPFVVPEPGIGWVGIYESGNAGYPRAGLVRDDSNTVITRLRHSPGEPQVAYRGITPFTSPWRLVVVAPARDLLNDSEIARDLAR